MISVLDYGVGNVGSVIRMIEHVGGDAVRITLPEEILSAEKIIIPGVGSFDYGMSRLISHQLLPALNRVFSDKCIPVLGICLGMQLFCRSSEEGVLPGLGWINADVQKFSSETLNDLRIPHMGWNTVSVIRDNPLLPFSTDDRRFYFVHSYKVVCTDISDAVMLTNYGGDFVSAFQRENIFGVQFHPEKSHRFGIELMRNFLRYGVA